MPDGNTPVRIDHDELVAHQQRLRGLLDRINTAGAAAGQVAMGSDAFGQLGRLLVGWYHDAEGEGVDMVRAAYLSTEDHIARVGQWASDWRGHEGDAVSLFNEVTVSNG